MQNRRWLIILLCVACIPMTIQIACADQQCAESYGQGKNSFSLATGSPGELGLLQVLGDTFGSQADARLCWIKAGSGNSLKMLKDKTVDMIMVHAPDAEKKAIADGWAVDRTLIGSNEFYLVGPPSDPAGIAKAKSASDAYAMIARSRVKFFSRGDNSGTHKKELAVWKQAGIEPSGDWYIVTKDFMTATLKRADTEQGYFMTDSSTWVAEKNSVPHLTILFRGDKFLINTYHALAQPKGATAGAAIAAKFISFVASARGQTIIREYGQDKHGEGLYNDAAYAKQYDD